MQADKVFVEELGLPEKEAWGVFISWRCPYYGRDIELYSEHPDERSAREAAFLLAQELDEDDNNCV